MKTKDLLLRAFLNALGVFAYVLLVAWVMFNSQFLFTPPSPMFLGPAAFLTLFIISATLTAWLVMGKPIHLYMDGHKKEATKMLLYTLSWLAVMFISLLAFPVMFLSSGI
ncbi:MAG: hypothetical protein ABIB04_02935 [Patescibacteria group bacterium]